MKRIPSKTAVRTVCYGLSGYQKVEIYDFENQYDLSMEQNGKLVCSGKLLDIVNDYRNAKWFDSQYHGMNLKGDTIVFLIFTRYEDY